MQISSVSVVDGAHAELLKMLAFLRILRPANLVFLMQISSVAVGDGAHAELLKMLAFLRIWRPEKRE